MGAVLYFYMYTHQPTFAVRVYVIVTVKYRSGAKGVQSSSVVNVISQWTGRANVFSLTPGIQFIEHVV